MNRKSQKCRRWGRDFIEAGFRDGLKEQEEVGEAREKVKVRVGRRGCEGFRSLKGIWRRCGRRWKR